MSVSLYPPADRVDVVEEFRKHVSSFFHNHGKYSDFELERFLIARSYHMDKAVDHFKKAMEYREKFHLDTVTEWFKVPFSVQTYGTGGYMGKDHYGHLVWCDPVGRADLKGFLHYYTKDELILGRLYHIEVGLEKMRKERMEALERRKDNQEKEQKKTDSTELETEQNPELPPVDNMLMVLDFEGFSWSHLYPNVVAFILYMISISETVYAEQFYRILIINTSWFFHRVFDLVKPMLSHQTKEKIQLASNEPSELLLQYIPRDQLFECYGGTSTDYSGVRWGGKFPSTFQPDVDDFRIRSGETIADSSS